MEFMDFTRNEIQRLKNISAVFKGYIDLIRW
jgi:hypothetical protein